MAEKSTELTVSYKDSLTSLDPDCFISLNTSKHRLVDGDHDIDYKIDGIGAMKLKSEFVKKGLTLQVEL